MGLFLRRVLGVAFSCAWGLGVIVLAASGRDRALWEGVLTLVVLLLPLLGSVLWVLRRPDPSAEARALRSGVIAGSYLVAVLTAVSYLFPASRDVTVWHYVVVGGALVFVPTFLWPLYMRFAGPRPEIEPVHRERGPTS